MDTNFAELSTSETSSNFAELSSGIAAVTELFQPAANIAAAISDLIGLINN